MKKLIILTITLLSLNSFASDYMVKDAQKAAMDLAQITFNHLGDRGDFNIFSTVVKEKKVYIEMAIGTTERPGRIHNCYIATFSNPGGIQIISSLEQQWDELCEFRE